MTKLIVISGCSGAGKSTLLDCLRDRGEMVVEEPGRRIIARERSEHGTALPWIDAAAFARRAVEMSLADIASVAIDAERIFFDRGLIDAAAALEHLTGEPLIARLGSKYRFHRRILMAPPWPEIYLRDDERKHGFEEGVSEYHRLLIVYERLGYEIVTLKIGVDDRADLVLAMVGA